MPKFIKFNAYYGTFMDYGASPKRTILFYTSATNNVKDVEVLNEPILDWDAGKAGNITFKLPPCNVGYDAIQCKRGHIFIERNGELIWHGRAINEVFDEELNREITCEGALNYLLDTHVKPLNVLHEARYRTLFDDLIDCHNRSLTAANSILFGKSTWRKIEHNGTIEANESEITFSATGTTEWRLAIWSSPSIWQYKDYKNFEIRVSFDATKMGSGSCTFAYGVHLLEKPWADGQDRIAYVDGPSINSSRHVSWSTWLGNGGLDGSGHEDGYIGFHMYLNSEAGVTMRITNLKVEFYYDYQDWNGKYFPVNEGLRTGAYRIPYDEEPKAVNISDYPTTLDAINSIFINEYGGYLCVGYEDNNDGTNAKHQVLNYIYGTYEKDEPSGILPEIRYGKNIISLKETTNWEDYPTVLIPLGRQKEAWEKALPAPNVSYTANRYLDTDGNLQTSSNGKYYIAELPVKEDDIYFIYGEGINNLGLFSILNSSNAVLDHKTFSNSEGNWYQHVEISIPKGGTKLRVCFNNEGQASTIATRIFKILKFNIEDTEEYITLDGYNIVHQDGEDVAMRTDELAGSKYYPIVDVPHIYEYGWIEKVVHFDDIESQGALLRKAHDYCARFQEAVKTYEVEAADLAPIAMDDDYIPIGIPGSYAKLIVPKRQIDKALCVTKVNLNLRNFAKSTYSLANLPPPDLADLIAKGLY